MTFVKLNIHLTQMLHRSIKMIKYLKFISTYKTTFGPKLNLGHICNILV